jgi:hypothetical protein
MCVPIQVSCSLRAWDRVDIGQCILRAELLLHLPLYGLFWNVSAISGGDTVLTSDPMIHTDPMMGGSINEH